MSVRWFRGKDPLGRRRPKKRRVTPVSPVTPSPKYQTRKVRPRMPGVIPPVVNVPFTYSADCECGMCKSAGGLGSGDRTMPVDRSMEALERVFQTATTNGYVVDVIWLWNRTVTPQIYEQASSLRPGYGYWIYAYYTCVLWATNLNPMTSTNYITTLSVKWNIFGVPVNLAVNKTTFIVNYLGTDYNWTQATTNSNPTGAPIVVKDIFGWTRTIPQGYYLTNILNAGECYWIYSYQTCILKRTL